MYEEECKMTADEKKVYECVKRNDDGRGLTASSYYDLYGSWNMPEFPSDMSKFDFDAALKAIKSNQADLNMSEARFIKILESLVSQGVIKKFENWNGEILYSVG